MQGAGSLLSVRESRNAACRWVEVSRPQAGGSALPAESAGRPGGVLARSPRRARLPVGGAPRLPGSCWGLLQVRPGPGWNLTAVSAMSVS